GTLNGTPYDLPIDTNATPIATDFNEPLAGALALSDKVAESGFAHDCVAIKWFEYANSRPSTAADECTLARLQTKFRQTDDMRELLLDIAAGDAALFIQETP